MCLNLSSFSVCLPSHPIRTIFCCFISISFSQVSCRFLYSNIFLYSISRIYWIFCHCRMKTFPLSIRYFQLDEPKCLPNRKNTNINIMYIRMYFIFSKLRMVLVYSEYIHGYTSLCLYPLSMLLYMSWPIVNGFSGFASTLTISSMRIQTSYLLL